MKRALLIAVSVALLAVLWWRTGWTELWQAVQRLEPGWLLVALLMFIPQTLLSGWRWAWIVRAYQPLRGWEATELVLASSALNIVLPSKAGDVVKGLWLRRDQPGGDKATGLALGLFEKGLDTVSLGVLMLAAMAWQPPTEAVGWLLAALVAGGLIIFALLVTRPVAHWAARIGQPERRGMLGKAGQMLGALGGVVLRLRAEPARFWLVIGSAVGLWALHMAQFSLALAATGASAPLTLVWSRVPLAIYVGLLPISFAGVGSRDTAMVYWLAGAIGEGPALLLALFATMRYVLVAVVGLFFVSRLGLSFRAAPSTTTL